MAHDSPCKQNLNVKCILLKVFYNIKHFYKGSNVVINAFEILKKIIENLLKKISTLFFSNVIPYCYVLYNVILNGKDVDHVGALMV